MSDVSLFFMQWIALISIFSLAVISPGPDFVVAVRNSIIYSRRVGILTAIGFGLGVLVHVTYTVFGIAAIISKSIIFFNVIKYAGAAYLIYIGFQALKSQGMAKSSFDASVSSQEEKKEMSDLSALYSGFLTNVLNPKATLFFLAIFSQIIRHDTPMTWQIVYGLTCAFMVIAWFSVVACVLTHTKVRNRFLKATKWIDRLCGSLMIALGIKVALTSR